MNIHHSFLFSYSDFIEEAGQYVNQLDSNSPDQFINRTLIAIRNLQNEWQFEDLGDGVLPTEDEIKKEEGHSNDTLGLWFRIILTEFLSPIPSVSSNWSVIYDVLREIGWEEEECNLLFRGVPTYKLLKPNEERIDHWPLTEESPYWMWLHPHWARAGWLPTDEIERLYKRFEGSKNELFMFDLKKLSSINVDDPRVVTEFKTNLEEGVTETSDMLTAAINADRGLFMAITIYA